jgi:spermidine synthase
MELAGRLPWIRRALAVAGGASLLAQVVLLREVLASSHGNELALGVVMAAWLAFTGGASALGGRLARTPTSALRGLAGVLALTPLLFAGALWLTQFASAGLAQDPSLGRVFLAATVAVLPACLSGGLAFAWAAESGTSPAGTAVLYVVETAGAAVAGLLFHFCFAQQLSSSWILLLAGVAAAGAAIGVVPARRTAGVAALAIVAAGLLRPAVDRALVRARFPGEQVLALQPSRYGLAAVIARGDQRVFLHDGVLLFTSEDALAAEETTYLPLLLHPRPRHVLLVGGGLGGGLAKALEHGPASLDYAEMDPALLDLARAYADPATRAALVDARVHATSGDARALLRAGVGQYDVVLIHVPVAQNALLARLSTRECITEARRALAPGGLLAVVTPGSDAHLDPAARLRHASLWSALAGAFPTVGVAPGGDTIFWASDDPVDARAEVLAARLRERGLYPLQIGSAWLFDRLLPFHAASYRRTLAATAAFDNRDFRPVVYLFGLVEGLEQWSPRLGRTALAIVTASGWGWALVVAFGLALMLVLMGRGRRAPGFAVAAAGAAGMALELVLLLGFQALVGHLYHAIGVLLAGFMVGMSAGAWQARRWLQAPRALAWLLAAAAAMAALVSLVLALGARWPSAAPPLLLAAIVAVGATTGAIYPAAVARSARAHAAASLYGWDLAGAAVAALLVSLVALPLFGLYAVVAGAAVLCAAAAAAVAVANR